MKFIFALILIIVSILMIGNSSCSNSLRHYLTNKKIDTEKGTYVEFVKHISLDAKGENSGVEEWYLRMSVQDYYIKWCDSEVTEKEIESLLEKKTGPIKTLKIDYVIKDGDWDNCDPKVIATSRTGLYAIITKVYE